MVQGTKEISVCNFVKDLNKNDPISEANEALCILTALYVLLEACMCVVYMKPAYLATGF